MPNQQETALRSEAQKSLDRMLQFNPETLSRESDLGSELNFKDVVPAAARLIALYRQISPTVLEDLPQQQLQTVQNQANADFNRLDQILKFSAKQGNPHNARTSLIQQVETAYQDAFTQLHPIISYSTSKSADFKRIEREARATLQTLEDKAAELTASLQQDKATSGQILEDIRKVAAQQGVSQQAHYFRETAQDHETQAGVWQKKITHLAILLGAYAVLTVFLHKMPLIKPDDAYQTVQLAISKVLIFGVLSYLLYLATKNYLAHKHNAVINKHRQNALMTYEAIVNAAKATPNKEVILTHASACMFAPQQTGYSGAASPDGPAAKSVVEVLSSKVMGEQ
jgi:hypothetical protein